LAHLALLKTLLRFRSAKSNSRNFSSPCKTETLLRFCCRHSLINITRLSLIGPDSENPSDGHLLSTTMPRLSVHEQTMRTYVFYMILWDLFTPAMDLEDLCRQHDIDMRAIHAIKHTRYLRGRSPVLKLGNLSLAWEFAQSPSDHKRFVNMLRVSPEVFDTLLCLINDHPIFYNNSNKEWCWSSKVQTTKERQKI